MFVFEWATFSAYLAAQEILCEKQPLHTTLITRRRPCEKGWFLMRPDGNLVHTETYLTYTKE